MKCKHPDTRIRQTREADGVWYHRRSCRGCAATFATVEIDEVQYRLFLDLLGEIDRNRETLELLTK